MHFFASTSGRLVSQNSEANRLAYVPTHLLNFAPEYRSRKLMILIGVPIDRQLEPDAGMAPGAEKPLLCSREPTATRWERRRNGRGISSFYNPTLY